MKLKAKLRKSQLFQLIFIGIVLLLLVVRACVSGCSPDLDNARHAMADSVEIFLDQTLSKPISVRSPQGRAHRIIGVSSYETAFPDANDVQLASAARHGITPRRDRAALEPLYGTRLVSIDSCALYAVDPLKSSVPYLVPRAQKLLAAVGRNFIDSLIRKHLPPAKVIVTSALRTLDDVSQLQATNVNSTTNSCHNYATTFDLSYTRYQPLVNSEGQPLRLVRDDTLKWVLSEVLRDLRASGACHVKHERKQGCFHITVK